MQYQKRFLMFTFFCTFKIVAGGGLCLKKEIETPALPEEIGSTEITARGSKALKQLEKIESMFNQYERMQAWPILESSKVLKMKHILLKIALFLTLEENCFGFFKVNSATHKIRDAFFESSGVNAFLRSSELKVFTYGRTVRALKGPKYLSAVGVNFPGFGYTPLKYEMSNPASLDVCFNALIFFNYYPDGTLYDKQVARKPIRFELCVVKVNEGKILLEYCYKYEFKTRKGYTSRRSDGKSIVKHKDVWNQAPGIGTIELLLIKRNNELSIDESHVRFSATPNSRSLQYENINEIPVSRKFEVPIRINKN